MIIKSIDFENKAITIKHNEYDYIIEIHTDHVQLNYTNNSTGIKLQSKLYEYKSFMNQFECIVQSDTNKRSRIYKRIPIKSFKFLIEGTNLYLNNDIDVTHSHNNIFFGFKFIEVHEFLISKE
jgi:hypothetical protein